jgi:hypothetical protein
MKLNLILREEQRLGMLENEVLRRIFQPRRDEETGWKQVMQQAASRFVQFSSNIIRIIKKKDYI